VQTPLSLTLGALAMVAALAPARASAASRPVVAVFSVELRGLGGVRAAAIDAYLATRLAETGRFELVPQARVQKALAARRRESHRPCYAQSCQIQIGQELAASHALVTQLHRLRGLCVVTSNLFDLRKATSSAAATALGACDEPSLLGLVDQVVAKLAPGFRPGPPPKGARRVRRGGAVAVPSGSAELVLLGTPEGAQAVVTARGLRRECRLPCRLPGLPGVTVALAVSAPGHRPSQRTVTLATGRISALSVDLEPAAPGEQPEPASTPVAAPPSEEEDPLRGLTLVALTRASRLRHQIPEPVNFGVVVAAVTPGSRAARAGLRAGDVLLELGGQKLESVAGLRRRLAGGRRANLLVHRQGKTLYLRF
jgi:hypothetical protein